MPGLAHSQRVLSPAGLRPVAAVAPTIHTDPMPRHIMDVYLGWDRQEVIVDIPIPFTRAGTWHGEIRARLVDDATQDWYFEIGYNTGISGNRIETFPVEWTRRPELDDYVGTVPPELLERTRINAADEVGLTTQLGSSNCETSQWRPACSERP
ncbi:hypothetical protein GCM10023339_40540 [Alloalcanivorax gelatiniphagus]